MERVRDNLMTNSLMKLVLSTPKTVWNVVQLDLDTRKTALKGLVPA